MTSPGAPTEPPGWADDLVHPLPLTAVALLIVNDHLLKGAGVLPGWATGKLSDLAGLFFFPLLLVAVAQGLISLTRRGMSGGWRGQLVVVCPVATGAVFAALKLFPATHAWFPLKIVVDPTDLVALPAVAAAAWWLRGARRASGLLDRRAVRLATVTLAALGSAATSRANQYAPALPYWKIVAPTRHSLGCASAEIWVSKSGKTGLGLTLALSTPTPTCRIEVLAAALTIAEASAYAEMVPPPVELTFGSTMTQYLAFSFDNDAAWRAGRRSGVVQLSVRANGVILPRLQLPLAQEVFAPHAAATLDWRYRVGCAHLTFEVVAVEQTRLGLSATVEAAERPCQIRVDAVRMEPSAPDVRVAQAPEVGLWHSLPATWRLELERADPPPPVPPPPSGSVQLDVTTSDGSAQSLRVPVLGWKHVQEVAQP